MYLKVFKIFVILISIKLMNSQNLLCSPEFCKAYKEQNDCPPTGTACDVQNATVNGELYSAEVPCGCCEICVENIKEGDHCTIGSPETSPPMMICGPGLYCKEDEISNDYRCRKMDLSPCTQEQLKYDEMKGKNKIGKFMKRPYCDGDGNYGPAKCSPDQTCFCVDEVGTRIFGEAPFTEELTMQCECTKLNHKFMKSMEFKNPVLTARCLENGDFDPLQCMANQCICVEDESGFPETNKFNMSVQSLSSLPCFDRKQHMAYKYLHDCEQNQEDYSQELRDSEDNGYIIDEKDLECQPDGWYHSIQENITHKFCVDKYQRKIENFIVSKESAEAISMHCKCARTQYLLKKNNIKILPDCCPNGNFKKVQCREKVCYCVDENGLQTEKEVAAANVKQLGCYNKGKFC